MKAETKHGSGYVGYYEYRHSKATHIDMNVSKRMLSRNLPSPRYLGPKMLRL